MTKSWMLEMIYSAKPKNEQIGCFSSKKKKSWLEMIYFVGGLFSTLC